MLILEAKKLKRMDSRGLSGQQGLLMLRCPYFCPGLNDGTKSCKALKALWCRDLLPATTTISSPWPAPIFP